MLPFVILTVLFATFATRNITELVTSSLEERVSNQLVGASQHTADELAKRERDHLQVVRAVAFTEGVSDAVRSRDTFRLGQLVLPAAANSGAEDVELFDLKGERVYGVRDAASVDERVELNAEFVSPSWTAVSAVLSGKQDVRGDKWAELVNIGSESWLVTAGPVEDRDGTLVGVVVVGTRVDSILRNVKRDAFTDVTLFDAEGAILGSTFDVNDAAAGNGFLGGTPGFASQGDVLGRPYRFLTSDLKVRDTRLGTFTVALPVGAVNSAGDSTRLRMSLIFAAITLAVIAIGWYIARQLTGPLSRLVTAAAAVTHGDLSARSNVRTHDEIGVLGLSFDTMAERLEQQHIATIGALASAIDARDPYTAGHSVRVGDLSAELGSSLGMPRAALHHLRVGGLLHDIGKIGIRDTVLLKPEKLSPDERRLIEQHPTIGLRILESAQLPREVLEIVGGHHERLDGSGYPLGLTLEEISAFPRITAVADMYDAITTDRPYRAGLSPQEALRILWRDAENGILDDEVVAAMRRIARVWEERRASQGVLFQPLAESLKTIRRSTRGAA